MNEERREERDNEAVPPSGAGTVDGESSTREPQPALPGPESVLCQPLISPILIAEDDESIAEALAYFVESAGFLPLVARNGKEALELARTKHPVLIFTDLMMPYMDGLQLLEALRADAASDGHSPPPVVLMTAGGLRVAQQAGADAVLPKPFTLAQLEGVVEFFLRSKP